MKTLILAAIAATSFATAGLSGGAQLSTFAGANYVEREMIWDENAQSTRATLVVDVDGERTRYEVGQLGLTKAVVMSMDPAVHAKWAQAATGRDLTAIVPGVDQN